jgi:colicin import membrane protein/protein TonB
MSAPATALGRHERIWPAVLLSGAIHAALVLLAVARAGPVLDLDQKPIAARLVKLGEARPPEWLPRRDVVPPPPAPAAPQAAAGPAAPAPPPAAAGKAPPAPGAARGATPGAGTSLSDVLSRVRKQVDEERWGSPEGDVMGEATEGDAGDRYLALVTRALHDAYELPPTLSEKDRLHLRAKVVLWVEPDGSVVRWKFESRSASPAFDDALERAVRRARLPPPPPEARELYRRTGVVVLFKAQP